MDEFKCVVDVCVDYMGIYLQPFPISPPIISLIPKDCVTQLKDIIKNEVDKQMPIPFPGPTYYIKIYLKVSDKSVVKESSVTYCEKQIKLFNPTLCNLRYPSKRSKLVSSDLLCTVDYYRTSNGIYFQPFPTSPPIESLIPEENMLELEDAIKKDVEGHIKELPYFVPDFYGKICIKISNSCLEKISSFIYFDNVPKICFPALYKKPLSHKTPYSIHSDVFLRKVPKFFKKVLYEYLSKCILSKDQLKLYGYPLESPNNPGKAEYIDVWKTEMELDNPQDRICSRCYQRYTITEDEESAPKQQCTYHVHKARFVKSYVQCHPCCNQVKGTAGCKTSEYHVSDQLCQKNEKFFPTVNKGFESNIYSMDCEMCYTTNGLEIARVSVLSLDGKSVYESFVCPESEIIDYNTEFSGITAKNLIDVKTKLADVQKELLELFDSNTILIGHSLEHDLKALRIIHNKVVDTAVLFPHEKGWPFRYSLKDLAKQYLGKDIHGIFCGHDSIEDAQICLQLVLWKFNNENIYHRPFGS